MGDFAKADLTRPDGLYPHLAKATCSGCGNTIAPDSRCYADHAHIWHSWCWPSTRAQTGSVTANPAGSPKVSDVPARQQPEGDDA